MKHNNVKANGPKLQVYDQIQALLQAREYTKALAVCNSAIQTNAKDALPHFLKGTIFHEQAKYDKAIESYQLALAMKFNEKQTSVNIYYYLAISCTSLQQFDQAAHYLELAVKHEPQNVMAWFNLGKVSIKLQNFARAEQAFTQAVENNLQNLEIYLYKGVAHYSLSQYSPAIEALHKALTYYRQEQKTKPEPSKKLAEIYFTLACSYYDSGDVLNAKKYIRKATDYPAASIVIAEIYKNSNSQRRESDLKKALQNYNNAVQLGCNSFHVLKGKITSYLELKNYGVAIALASQALTTTSDKETRYWLWQALLAACCFYLDIWLEQVKQKCGSSSENMDDDLLKGFIAQYNQYIQSALKEFPEDQNILNGLGLVKTFKQHFSLQLASTASSANNFFKSQAQASEQELRRIAFSLDASKFEAMLPLIADINGAGKETGMTALHRCVDVNLRERALDSTGKVDSKKLTELKEQQRKIVKLLNQRDVNLNAQDNKGNTAAHLACQHKNYYILIALLAIKRADQYVVNPMVDICLPNKAGQTVEQAFEATVEPNKFYSETSLVTILRSLFNNAKQSTVEQANAASVNTRLVI